MTWDLVASSYIQAIVMDTVWSSALAMLALSASVPDVVALAMATALASIAVETLCALDQ